MFRRVWQYGLSSLQRRDIKSDTNYCILRIDIEPSRQNLGVILETKLKLAKNVNKKRYAAKLNENKIERFK